MFPTLSSLIEYFTGYRIQLPVQTFGLIVALSFWLSYLAFKAEFRRKEKEGKIGEFKSYPANKRAVYFYYVLYSLLVFLLGYKLVYAVKWSKIFMVSPQQVLFSANGDIIGGVLFLTIFLVLLYYKAGRNISKPVDEKNYTLVHPYEVTDRMLLWCASIGFIGAILFAKLEQWSLLFSDPGLFFTSYNGLNFLGGFIFGAGIYFYRCRKMGINMVTAADIGSPGIMLAYGFGRIGCHLSGDGDWGIINNAPKPSSLSWLPNWVWAYDYPHNVIHAGKYIEGCTGTYCNILVDKVYPTSFYEFVIGMSLFFLLWMFRRKINRDGMMFLLFISLLGLERFMIEFIKVNPRHCIGNVCLTQSQYISIAFMLIGAIGFALISWKKFQKRKNFA